MRKSLRWLAPAAVFLWTFAAFLPALRNGFVDLDDFLNLINNPAYRGLGRAQLEWMFTTFHSYHYQPLSWLTLGFDYVVWGMDPAGYHLTSLLLHSANAVLFYFVCKRLLSAALPDACEEDAARLHLGAACAALLFSLHPLRVESVAWATERRDVLSGFFYLATAWVYLKSFSEPAPSRRWRVLGPAFFLFSLLSKGVGVSLPLVLVLLDVYPLRRLPSDPRRWLEPEFRRLWVEKTPYLVMALAFGCVGWHIQSLAHSGTVRTLAGGLSAHAALAAYALVFYLGKTLVPVGLYPMYELPYRVDPFTWIYVASLLFIAALSAALMFSRRRFPAGLAAWAFFLLTLAPLLGIVAFAFSVAADRNTYLACLGFAALAGGGLVAWRRAWGWSAALCVLVALSALTWRQTKVWKDAVTLWSHALAAAPDAAFAHNSLGAALVERGAVEEGLGHLRRSIELRPDSVNAHNNLGNALLARRRPEEAARHYERAAILNPSLPEAFSNLGSALISLGRRGEAVAPLEKALRLDPRSVAAHVNLGNALVGLGRAAEAAAHYREALAVKPDFAAAHNNLGFALAVQEKYAEAGVHFREALRLQPVYPEAKANLEKLQRMR